MKLMRGNTGFSLVHKVGGKEGKERRPCSGGTLVGGCGRGLSSSMEQVGGKNLEQGGSANRYPKGKVRGGFPHANQEDGIGKEMLAKR